MKTKRQHTKFRQVATCETCEHKTRIDIQYNKDEWHWFRCCEKINVCFDGEGYDSNNVFYSAAIASPDNSVCNGYSPRDGVIRSNDRNHQIITIAPDIDEFGTKPEPGKITVKFDEQLGISVRIVLLPEVAECLKDHLTMALGVIDNHEE